MQSFNVAQSSREDLAYPVRWVAFVCLASTLPILSKGEFLPRKLATSTRSAWLQFDKIEAFPESSSWLQFPMKDLLAQSRNHTRSTLLTGSAKGAVVTEDFLKRKGIPVNPEFRAWVEAN